MLLWTFFHTNFVNISECLFLLNHSSTRVKNSFHCHFSFFCLVIYLFIFLKLFYTNVHTLFGSFLPPSSRHCNFSYIAKSSSRHFVAIYGSTSNVKEHALQFDNQTQVFVFLHILCQLWGECIDRSGVQTPWWATHQIPVLALGRMHRLDCGTHFCRWKQLS
jgi:hypothetical protein